MKGLKKQIKAIFLTILGLVIVVGMVQWNYTLVAEAKDYEMTLLSTMNNIPWNPEKYSGELESVTTSLNKKELTKLRIYITYLPVAQHYKLFEVEILDANGKNIATEATAQVYGSSLTTKEGIAIENINDGSKSTGFYRISGQTRRPTDEYIEFTFSERTAVSEIRFWSSWCYNGYAIGDAPLMWDIYGYNGPSLKFIEDEYKLDSANQIVSCVPAGTTAKELLNKLELSAMGTATADIYDSVDKVSNSAKLKTGNVLRLSDGKKTYAEYTIAVFGDVDEDGQATIADTVYVDKNLDTLTILQKYAASLNEWNVIGDSGDIVWESTEQVLESKKVEFDVIPENITSLRLSINATNESQKYELTELKLYGPDGKNLAPEAVITVVDGMETERLSCITDSRLVLVDNSPLFSSNNFMNTNLEGEYYFFKWSTPVTICSAELYSIHAKSVAPTNFDIAYDFGEAIASEDLVNHAVLTAYEPKEPVYSDKKETDVPASSIEKEGYNLIFSDEFDGEEIDTEKWLPQYFPHATTLTEGCQTTYEMEDGSLCLYLDVDTPKYMLGSEMKVSSIQTIEKNLLHEGASSTNRTNVNPYESFACQYGYFEMRAKLPNAGANGYAAWWLIGAQDDARADGSMSKQDGEIDIIETPLEYTNVFSPKVHGWNDPDLTRFIDETKLEGDYDDYYHTYAIDWTPSGITFYVDGEEICSTTNSPQYRMGMVISLYADLDNCGPDNGVWPKAFYIDYIRVYQDENGYPDGVTKDPTPVVLPEDLATQYKGEVVTDEIMAQKHTNFLKSCSTATLNGEESDLAKLYDDDYTSGLQSPDELFLPDEYEFTWEKPITADTLRVATWFAAGQGPTFIDVQVKKAGGEYESVALSNIEWKTSTEANEYVDIAVKAEQIIGLKFVVNKANLQWGHYVINELRLFLEEENATKVQAKQLENEMIDDNLKNIVDELKSTGGGKGLTGMVDKNFADGYVSEDNPILPQELELSFKENLQTVYGIRLSSNFSMEQAPTLVDVYVKEVDGAYTKVGSYYMEWQSKDNVNEHCDLEFAAQSNVEAVKIVVKKANLTWQHYVISELQIKTDEEKDNATKVQAKQLENAIVVDDLTNFADEFKSTGGGKGLTGIVDKNFADGYVSEDNPILPQELELSFKETPQTVEAIRLSSNFSMEQAPTLVDVYVKKVDGAYMKVGSYYMEWQCKDNVNEHCDLEFAEQSNVEAVKIVVKRANLTWQHFVISELQIF